MTSTYTRDLGVELSNHEIHATYGEINSRVIGEISDKNIQGLQIVTPDKINVDNNNSFPLAWITAYNDYRHWEVIKEQNSHLILTDLNSGVSRVFYMFATHKRRNKHYKGISSKGIPPNDDMNSRGVSMSNYDVRKLTNMDWGNGNYALTMLMYDWRSNTELTRLESANSELKSGFSLDHVMHHYIINDVGSQYGKIESIKKIDSDITTPVLSLPEVIKSQDKILSCSVMMKVTQEMLFSLPSNSETYSEKAIVFTLVLNLLDESDPYTYNMVVQLKDSQSILGHTVNISFNISLEQLLMDAAAENLHVMLAYLVTGKSVIGPTRLNIKYLD